MKFYNFIIFMFIFCPSVLIGMKPEETAPSHTLWNSLKNEGPLKTLGFDMESISSNGRVVNGWLGVQIQSGENLIPDKVYSSINLHNDGYSITFKDYVSKKKLPKGLYFWKSTSDVREEPVMHDPYVLFEQNSWIKKEAAVPKLFSDKHYQENLYWFIPSVRQAFQGPYTVFIKNLKPSIITIKDEDINMYLGWMEDVEYKNLEHGWVYNNMTEQIKQHLFSSFPPEYRNSLIQWLKDKMTQNHIPVAEQPEIAKEFLVERMQGPLQRLAALKMKKTRKIKGPTSIDLFELFEEIDDLRECSQEQRKAFNHYLQNEESPERAKAITARSKIICTAGMYQWD